MSTKELCERYLAALDAGDLAAVRGLFTDDAVVVSPLYGERPAHAFYAELFADTDRSATTLINVFDSSSAAAAVALHFRYEWTLRGGRIVGFECVDVFELAQDRDRFARLTIIYDTAHLRAAFEAGRLTPRQS